MSESDELRKIYLALTDRINDVFLRVEALLLESLDPNGLIHDQFEERLRGLETLWASRLKEHLADEANREELERLRRLLESHEGTKQ